MANDPHEAAAHGGALYVLHEEAAKVEVHAESTSHTDPVLTYLVSGSLRMDHGGPIRAYPGTITLVPAGVPHRPLAGSEVNYWLTSFCPGCLGLDESQPLMSPFQRVRAGATPVIEVAKSRRQRVVRLYRELQEENARDAPEAPELARALLLLLLGEVRRATPGSEIESPAGSLVSEALEFIQRHNFEGISLKDVAAAVSRTPTHVAASVQKSTGHSVGEWITAGRVAEAAARLAHTDHAMAAIAQHVGWQDTTHFIRQFRKAYGVTPAAWRREHRARHTGPAAAE